MRRVNISDPKQPMLTDFIDPKKVTYLPNTAGCFTAEDAIRTLRLAREAGGWNLVKLEVLGEAKTLYPDMRETLRATEVLVKEGFEPMVYCVDDPIAAKQLEEAGAVAIMPLGAPIGSGLGIQNRVTIRLIVEGASVPVLVDAGVGTASDAAVAMELGCDGVLMNTAIAEAKDPVLMARGDEGARSRRGGLPISPAACGKRRYADPSQPAGGIDLSAYIRAMSTGRKGRCRRRQALLCCVEPRRCRCGTADQQGHQRCARLQPQRARADQSSHAPARVQRRARRDRELDLAARSCDAGRPTTAARALTGGINDIVVAANGGAYRLRRPVHRKTDGIVGRIIYMAPGSDSWTESPMTQLCQWRGRLPDQNHRCRRDGERCDHHLARSADRWSAIATGSTFWLAARLDGAELGEWPREMASRRLTA